MVPSLRLRALNDRPLRPKGAYVLYWMIAARRTVWNFGLQHALERAAEAQLPLIVLEALRAGHRYANDRLHAFALAGMADNRAAFEGSGVLYHPYLEPEPGAGRGLLAALAEQARLVVTDDYPAYFLPRMVAAAGERLDVRLEAVDSNGLLPLRAADRTFARAYDFRRFLQKELLEHLSPWPLTRPLERIAVPARERLPRGVAERWPAADEASLAVEPAALARLPIDHGVPPAPHRGGAREGARRLASFVAGGLARYAEERDEPEAQAVSGLSPWLHWGHVGAHQAFAAVAHREGWKPERAGRVAHAGSREGWWGMSAGAEAFLDQLVTWRELGFNFCSREPDPYAFESLPDWARATLLEHASDRREPVYDRGQLERAETHDELWNAAQNQLRTEGLIHNYLRMLWGKKVLEWTRDPREALSILIELNDRYALDGRDPNSASGIAWIFGRYDRPWGPERPIYGKIRYMTSANTRRKLHVEAYVERWSG